MRWIAVVCAAAALSACGGGGGDGANGPVALASPAAAAAPATATSPTSAEQATTQAPTTAGWQPGMPRPKPNDPSTTTADMARYDAWCKPQAEPRDCQPFDALRPDVAVASMHDIELWNRYCSTARCMIDLPAPSGVSLNWWGTDPRLIEAEESRSGIAIPDGDKLVWNFACEPQPSCRIRLSRSY